jgi:1-acyl-sn-glycerol-3-phosphate acyltransferase
MIIIRHLFSLYFVTMFAVVAVVFITITAVLRVLTGWFDRRLYLLHLVSCVWASLYTWLNPLWSVSVSGREHIRRDKACIMVCNHQSNLDIVVLYRLFVHFKWVAKSSLFNVPFVGWNLYLNRYIRVARSSLSGQRKMIRLCEKNLRKGSSIMVFAEGTRSKDGRLQPFKKGAFHIAEEQQVDVQPIVIDGTSRLLAGYPLNFQRIQLHVLPPVTVDEYRGMSENELCNLVRERMAAELDAMRQNARN